MKSIQLPGMILVSIFLVIGLTGCGDGVKRCAVEGTVTVDGQPVQEGSILFRPKAGTSGPVSGASIKDGHYQIESANGPVLGEYQVAILGLVPTGRKKSSIVDGEKVETDEMKNIIPKKHLIPDETQTKDAQMGTEPLSATIVKGKNVVDFNMTN